MATLVSILLSTLCFEFKDYKLGKVICDFYLNSKKEDEPNYFTMSKWRNIYTNLVNYESIPNEKIMTYEKKLLVIISFEDFLSKELFESLSDEFEIVYFAIPPTSNCIFYNLSLVKIT